MRRTIAVLVCALAFSASGCTSTNDKTPVDIQDASPSPSQTAAEPGDVDSLLDYVPDEPDEPKQEFTKAGAIAFAEYYFKVQFYAYGQADPGPLAAISDPGCAGCKQPLENLSTLQGTDGVIIGEGEPTLSGSKVASTDENIVNVSTTVSFPRISAINSSSGEQSGDWGDAVSGKRTLGLEWDDDTGWTMLNYKDLYS